MGIGLAIVKKCTERLGGTTGIESTPGEGSTFWLELPKANGKFCCGHEGRVGTPAAVWFARVVRS